MDFSQHNFWFILLLSISFLMIARRWNDSLNFKKIFILTLSLILLGLASLQTLIIFLLVSSLAYISCLIGKNMPIKRKRYLLIFLIFFLLLPLIYYKYSHFLTRSLLQCEWDSLQQLIIPIGISFYTFQIIAFSIDTLIYKRPVPPICDYMNFCSFFPQIVAGPIERRDDLLPQLQKMKILLSSNELAKGIPYIILGLFFKMSLADNLSSIFWEKYSGTSAWIIWINNIIFAFRIYFDFAGYGLIAFGIAQCLGINLRMNFLSPYTACNINDFWRRWHISLTLWFRDYIYFPLGGSRTRKWALNILIVFLISGLWHGAGWNFIIWGGLSGIGLIIHRFFRHKGYSIPSMIGWLITFIYMVFVWMFFYDSDLTMLKKHLEIIFHIDNYKINDLLIAINAKPMDFATLPWIIGLSIIVIFIEYLSILKMNHPYALFLTPTGCGMMVFCLILFLNHSETQFVYFAF